MPTCCTSEFNRSGNEHTDKSEFIGEVAGRTGLNRKNEAGMVDTVFEALTEAFGRQEEVRIRQFGLFTT